VCTHACMSVYVHAFMFICCDVLVQMCMRSYVMCMCTCMLPICARMCLCACVACVCTLLCVCLCVCVQVYGLYVCVCVCACMGVFTGVQASL